MKVLVISGSHRPKQVTYQFSEKFAEKIKGKRDVDIEICELANLNLKNCCGTGECIKTPEMRCVHNDDDFNKLFDKINESDAVLFIVPKYAPYPSKIMALMERIMAISYWGYEQYGKMDEFAFAKKPAAIVAFASTAGIPIEVFYPLFFNFAGLGFETITFNQIPGMYINRADNKDEQMLDDVAQAFAEKLA